MTAGAVLPPARIQTVMTEDLAHCPEAETGVTDQTQAFVHLRVHSAYSLLEGALTIPRLVALAAENRMPALAITDSNNLFGALEFSEAVAGARIQPIVGCTLSLSFAVEEEEATPDCGGETAAG